MARRLLSVLGSLAMLIAFLPGIVDAASANLPACCTGAMCPFHQMASAKVICDTSSSPRDADLERCPDQTTHYTVALIFVRMAPAILFAQPLVGAAASLPSSAPAKVAVEVPYPPPRLALT
jgi:hypothetical protein